MRGEQAGRGRAEVSLARGEQVTGHAGDAAGYARCHCDACGATRERICGRACGRLVGDEVCGGGVSGARLGAGGRLVGGEVSRRGGLGARLGAGGRLVGGEVSRRRRAFGCADFRGGWARSSRRSWVAAGAVYTPLLIVVEIY
jgi:hypothetical protein